MSMSQPLILVMEDDELSLRLYHTILQAKGYRVISARDGITGIAMVRQNMPALIIMDIEMPKMDGLTATRILKKDSATVGIPVMIVSSFAMQEDREKGYRWGCDCYLTKPIDYREFLVVIDELLHRGTAYSEMKKVR